MKQRRFTQPATIWLLWTALLSVLALTVVANLFVKVQAWFGLDGTFAFNAWYGFSSCIGMIVFAKLLGRLLHRKDTYYERD